MKFRNLYLVFLLLASTAFSQTLPYKDVSTHFDGMGETGGGCGVPVELLEWPYFVALNVYDTPGEYNTFWKRPLSGSELSKMGEYKNGLNCGRWVSVTVDAFCQGGINDGVPGHQVCQGGTWVDDKFSGASLNFIVSDACGDGVVWCRDRKYHLDLSTNSLSEFTKNGVKVGSMLPDQFHNRMITWKYIKAPNYQGDIKIYWIKNAQKYWPCLLFTNLENGLTSVEQKVNGNWIATERNGDNGQSFILLDHNPPFVIRLKDADNKYIQNGREYTVILPPECTSGCAATTLSTYTTYNVPTLLDRQKSELGHIFLVSSKNQLTFNFSSKSSKNNISIYDLTGHIITSKVVEGNDGLVDMESINSGFYIVVLSNENGVVAHAKICL